MQGRLVFRSAQASVRTVSIASSKSLLVNPFLKRSIPEVGVRLSCLQPLNYLVQGGQPGGHEMAVGQEHPVACSWGEIVYVSALSFEFVTR